MTTAEILKKYPTSNVIALVDVHGGKVRFVRDDEWGHHYCDPPSDWRTNFNVKPHYKPVFRRKMGRA